MAQSLSRTCEPSHLVKEVKRGSSLWLKTKGPDLRDFAWQSGYAMFSLGFTQIDSARASILRQPEHHREVSFQDEFRTFLQRYEIAFDERYVWDGFNAFSVGARCEKPKVGAAAPTLG